MHDGVFLFHNDKLLKAGGGLRIDSAAMNACKCYAAKKTLTKGDEGNYDKVSK
jgi:hypothetical protein